MKGIYRFTEDKEGILIVISTIKNKIKDANEYIRIRIEKFKGYKRKNGLKNDKKSIKIKIRIIKNT